MPALHAGESPARTAGRMPALHAGESPARTAGKMPALRLQIQEAGYEATTSVAQKRCEVLCPVGNIADIFKIERPDAGLRPVALLHGRMQLGICAGDDAFRH